MGRGEGVVHVQLQVVVVARSLGYEHGLHVAGGQRDAAGVDRAQVAEAGLLIEQLAEVEHEAALVVQPRVREDQLQSLAGGRGLDHGLVSLRKTLILI